MHREWKQNTEEPIIPSDSTPIADNNSSANIRTGSSGSSIEYSRSDHKHPIVRQSPPPRPDLTFQGPSESEMVEVRDYDTWTDEESVTFAYRMRVDVGTTTGWNIIRVASIPGFQVPQITVEGTYRIKGNPSDSVPLAPYMGNEANHYSSTQRIYIGQYKYKTAGARYYVSVTVRYVRN